MFFWKCWEKVKSVAISAQHKTFVVRIHVNMDNTSLTGMELQLCWIDPISPQNLQIHWKVVASNTPELIVKNLLEGLVQMKKEVVNSQKL